MIGKSFQDFVIVRLLGSGGMGKVYLAVQKSLDREIALKVISTENTGPAFQELIERFLREARMAASIQHPNIVNIYSAGREEGFCYIAMEYVAGSSLEAEIAKGLVAEAFVWNLALQVCHALQTALQNDIIHRDIKPANILLTQKRVAKLTDFGISKKTTDQSHLTQAGLILGTPHYMSPEQAAGDPLDFRSDIYSLGATIYHSLTGHTLFTGDTALNIIVKHKTHPVTPPQDFVPSLKPESTAILGKMLNKNAADRYASYSNLLADITALLNNKPVSVAATSGVTAYGNLSGLPSQPKTRRILDFFMPGSAKTKTVKGIALFVGGFATVRLQEAMDKAMDRAGQPMIHVTSITTMSELKVSLAQFPARVILEQNYLGPLLFDFCDLLRRDFPDTPTIILSDAAACPLGAADGVLCLPYGSDETTLATMLLPHLAKLNFSAKEYRLSTLLTLAKTCQWNLALRVTSAGGDAGTIMLQQGSLSQGRYQQLRGDLALRALLEHGQQWQLDARQTDTAMITVAPEKPAARTASKPQSQLLSGQETLIQHGESPLSSDDQQTILSPAPVPITETTHYQILVVDDNPSRGETTAMQLGNCGHLAICANQGSDALSLLEIENFNIVMSQAYLTGSTPLPLYQEIAHRFPDVWQIVISGETDSSFASPWIVFLDFGYSIADVVKIVHNWQITA